MSCSALNCTNRPSPGSNISFYRFPLGDKDRLQKWLVNVRRDNFMPSPSARICSRHFEDSCFFMNNRGKLCLSKTAVPTIFHFPISFRSWRKYRSGDTRRKFVEVDVILDETMEEEDASDADIAEAIVTPAIYPTEICVVGVRHDHCYRSSSNAARISTDDSDTTAGKQETESPEILRHKLNLVLDKMKACRKKMKAKNQMIRRLKRKVMLLKAKVQSERSQRQKMHVILGQKFPKDLNQVLQPKLQSQDQ